MSYGISLATDEDGRFTFAGLVPARYSIGTNLSGYHRGGARAQPSILRDDIEVGPGQRVSIGVVRLAP